MEQEKRRVKNIVLDKIKQYRVMFTGVLLVIASYIVIMAVEGYYPFGDQLLASSDTLGQYIPFLTELRRKLFSGESLDYSWAGSIGTNFYYTIVYYLSSPLNWWMLLFPVTLLLKVLNFSIILKAVLSFCAMYYFLIKRPVKTACDKNSPEVLLFSLAYVFCNAFISSTVFYPFIDGFIMLPLVILGLEQFVANRGWKFYFWTLALSIVCNYYIGAIICLFIILYYLTLQFGSVRDFFQKSVRILGISIMAVGAATIVWLPAVYEMTKGAYSVSEFMGIGFFANWFDVLQEGLFMADPVFTGTTYWEVNLYFGMLPMLLACTYIFNRRIPKNVRIRKGILCALFVCSFNESLLNYVIHLLHYPHGIPNRQTFLFVFLCLTLAQESFSYMKEKVKSVGKIAISLILVVLIVFIVLIMLYSTDMGSIYNYMWTLDLLLIYGAILILKDHFEKERAFPLLLTVLGVMELSLMVWHGYNGERGWNVSSLSATIKDAKAVIKENEDDSFYHVATVNMPDIVNQGNLMGFPGLSIHSSTCNTEYIKNIRQWGFMSDIGAVSDTMGTPLTYSLLNIKYIMSYVGNDKSYSDDGNYNGKYKPEEDYPLFKHNNQFKLYKNDKVLAPVMVAENNFEEYEKLMESIQSDDRYGVGEVQNLCVKELCGLDNLIKNAEAKLVKVTSKNCHAEMQNGILVVRNESDDTDKTATVTIRIKALQNSPLYVNFGTLGYIGKTEAGKEYTYTFKIPYYSFDENDLFINKLSYYSFDEAKWQEIYEKLSKQQMKITKHTDNRLEGTLTSEGAHKVFTTIPYDSNWNIKVDGKKVKTKNIANAFLSFDVPNGQHQIEMVYHQKGKWTSIIITVFFLLLYLMICYYTKNSNKGKQEISKIEEETDSIKNVSEELQIHDDSKEEQKSSENE